MHGKHDNKSRDEGGEGMHFDKKVYTLFRERYHVLYRARHKLEQA